MIPQPQPTSHRRSANLENGHILIDEHYYHTGDALLIVKDVWSAFMAFRDFVNGCIYKEKLNCRTLTYSAVPILGAMTR